MALTLDGALPSMGGFGGNSGSGVGLGAVGGGAAGLILGGLLGAGLAGNKGWGNNGGNGWNGGGFAAPATTAVATDIVLNPAFQSLQNQVEQLGDQLNTNEITSQIGQLGEQVANYNTNVLSAVGNVATAQAAANFTTLQSINGLGRDVTAQANQNALQQLNSFNNLTTTTLQGFNSSAMQVQNSTNQIIAQGAANAAAVATGFCDISKQLAQCCCEIKGVIAADGNATRALINDLNVQNLRDQLSAANNKVSNNEQNQYLLSTILKHITPTAGAIV